MAQERTIPHGGGADHRDTARSHGPGSGVEGYAASVRTAGSTTDGADATHADVHGGNLSTVSAAARTAVAQQPQGALPATATV